MNGFVSPVAAAGVAADERVDDHGGDRRAGETYAHVAVGRRVAAKVGDVRDDRERRTRHQRDDAGEADPGQVLVG